MAQVVAVTGLDKVLSNLKKVDSKLSHRVEIGLKRAGEFLFRESQKIVPVQTTNLKGSGFCRKVSGSGKSADIVVGYTAGYATYVHENPNAAHGKAFNIKHAEEIAHAGRLGKARPQQSGLNLTKYKFEPTLKAGRAAGGMFPRKEEEQYKFLEKPMKENRDTILRILKDAMKF